MRRHDVCLDPNYTWLDLIEYLIVHQRSWHVGLLASSTMGKSSIRRAIGVLFKFPGRRCNNPRSFGYYSASRSLHGFPFGLHACRSIRMRFEGCQWTGMVLPCPRSCVGLRRRFWRYGHSTCSLGSTTGTQHIRLATRPSLFILEHRRLLLPISHTCVLAFFTSTPHADRGMLTVLLQEYVKARLPQFVGEPIFAKRMYQTSEGVQRAAKEVLTELSIPAGKGLPDGVSGAYTLLFRHECRYLQAYKELCD